MIQPQRFHLGVLWLFNKMPTLFFTVVKSWQDFTIHLETQLFQWL